ncbi:MAG TPA: hypothetical protein VIY48_08970 [Candidatus Paceibacterota bacterium]
MFTEPNETQKKDLGTYYKTLLEKGAEAKAQHGPLSQQYAVAISVLTATVSAVQVSFGFETTRQAHNFLRGIAKVS